MTVGNNMQDSWARGVLSPRRRPGETLEPYRQSAKELVNVMVTPQATLCPFPGSTFVEKYSEPIRGVPFKFSEEILYDLIFRNEAIDVWSEGVLLTTVTSTPWQTAHLEALETVQYQDELYIVHGSVKEKRLVRYGDTTWAVEDWDWYKNPDGNNRWEQPYHKFERPTAQLGFSATSGTITVTAYKDSSATQLEMFTADHVGVRFRVLGKEFLITAVGSPPSSTATASAVQTLSSTARTPQWQEAASSAARGYFSSIGFYEQRLTLVPSGARNRVFHSRTDDFFNFTPEGNDDVVLDTHAIRQILTAETYQGVLDITTRDKQQIFLTTGGLWDIHAPSESNGFSPSNSAQTHIHNVGGVARTLQLIGTSIVFAPIDGRTLYENAFDTNARANLTKDVLIKSEHLFSEDARIVQVESVDTPYRMIFLRLSNGRLVGVTHVAEEEVFAPFTVDFGDWTLEDMYVLEKGTGHVPRIILKKGNDYFFCEMPRMDSQDVQLHLALRGSDVTAKTTWSGLDHLEGEFVTVVADDGVAVWEDIEVVSGDIELPKAANSITAGIRNPVSMELLTFPREVANLFPRNFHLDNVCLRFGKVVEARRLYVAIDDQPEDELWGPQAEEWSVKEYPNDFRPEHVVKIRVQDPLYWELNAIAYDYTRNGL